MNRGVGHMEQINYALGGGTDPPGEGTPFGDISRLIVKEKQ